MPKLVAQSVLKIVAQCRKRVIPDLYTLKRTLAYAYTLPNANAYLNTCIPYLNTFITYLITLTRLPTPYLNTLNRNESAANENPRQPIRILGSQSESSAANQNPRQPIKILGSQSESSITSPESSLRHSRALGSGGGPFLALGSSRLAIAYLNT